jgi:hypothetical protein
MPPRWGVKSWNQLLYHRVIEVCRLPFEPRHDFFLYLIIVIELAVTVAWIQEYGENPMFHLQSHWSPETHLLPVRSVWETSAQKMCWEIVWLNAPRTWRDFGSKPPFQTTLTQTKPVLPLSNEHGSQVKGQGQWQCCHNKHKKFPYRPTRDVSLLSRHASYCILITISDSRIINIWGLHFSGMWCCIIEWLVPVVWKQYSDLIYHGKIVHKDTSFFTEISTLEDQTITIPQNAGHQSPDDAASHPIRIFPNHQGQTDHQNQINTKFHGNSNSSR